MSRKYGKAPIVEAVIDIRPNPYTSVLDRLESFLELPEGVQGNGGERRSERDRRPPEVELDPLDEGLAGDLRQDGQPSLQLSGEHRSRHRPWLYCHSVGDESGT